MSIRNAGLTPRQSTKRGQIKSDRMIAEATKTVVDRTMSNAAVGPHRDRMYEQMSRERLGGWETLGGSRPASAFTVDSGGHMSEQDPALKRIEEIQRTRNVSYTEAAMIFSNQYPQEAADYRQRVLTQADATTRPTTLDATRGTGAGSAAKQFESRVDAKLKQNPRLGYANAIIACANEDPDLARRRNAEIMRIGPGGVAMTNF